MSSGLGASAKAAVALGAAFAGAALVKGILGAVDAASDLNESVSKSRAVFGDAGSAAVEAFAKTATSIGLSERAAVEAAGTFGNLFTSLGLAREEAVKLSPDVVRLGADLASFNNLGVDESLEKLRSGLIGEIEPLRSLGISFNAAQVEAKAMELGLASANEEVSEGAKVQARWALIMEQSTNAQGDFARTSDGLANQQRVLAAEWENVRTAIGAGFLPVMLEAVAALRDSLPAIQEAAMGALPALAGSFRAILPAGISVLQLLIGLGPVLEVAAKVIEALPAPVIQLATAMLLLGRGLGPLPGIFSGVGAAMTGAFAVGAGGSKVTGALTAGFAALNPWVLGATVGFVALTSIMQRNSERAAENRREIAQIAAAFNDLETALDADVDSLVRSRIEAEGQQQRLRELGLTYDDVTNAILGQTAAGDKLGAVYEDEARRLDGYNKELVSTKGFAGDVTSEIAKLTKQVQEQAKAQIEAAVANGVIAESYARALEEQNRLSDGTVNYVGALGRVQEISKNTTESTAELTDATGTQTVALEEVKKAYDDALKALDDYVGGQLNALGIAIDFEASLDTFTQGLRDNTTTMDINTEKGRDNLSNLIALRDSILDVAKARFEETGSADDAAAAVAEHTTRLVAEMRQAGFSESAIKAYIDRLNLTPDEVKTALSVDTGPASKALSIFDLEVKARAHGIGVNFAEGVRLGLLSKEGELTRAGKYLAGKIEQSMNDRFANSSPSKVGMKIGGFFAQGVAIGIEQQSKLAQQAAQAMAADVARAVYDPGLSTISGPASSVSPAYYVPSQNIQAGTAGGIAAAAAPAPTQAPMYVTINPKTAVYDAKSTVATLRQLELLRR